MDIMSLSFCVHKIIEIISKQLMLFSLPDDASILKDTQTQHYKHDTFYLIKLVNDKEVKKG